MSHQVTDKNRDRIIYSVIIFIVIIGAITLLSYISQSIFSVVIIALAGLKLGDFVVDWSEKLYNWLDNTW